MKKTIKILSVSLSVLFLVSLLSACSGDKGQQSQTQSQNQTAKDHYKLSFATHGAVLPTSKPKYYDEVMGKINERLKKDLGFTVDITVKSYPDDVFQEKINLDIASRVSYDLIRTGDSASLAAYVDQKMALDITKYIGSASNLKKNITENVFKELTIDGSIYGIPLPAYPINSASWVRKDVFDEFGLNIPTTLPELENVLKVLKEKKYTADNQIVWAVTFADLEQYLYGNFTETPGDYLDTDGRIKPKFYNPAYKTFLSKLNEWYNKKYVDEFLFSGTMATSNDLLNRDRAAISGSNVWMLEYGTLKAINKAKPQFKITFMPQLKDAKKYFCNGLATEYLWVPITAKNPEIAVKFQDWSLYNEEIYQLLTAGIEGKTFVKNGDAFEIPEVEKNDKVKQISDLMGAFNIGYNVNFNVKHMSNATPSESLRAYKEYLNVDINRLFVPTTKYTLTKLEDSVKIKYGDAMAKVNEGIADIIRGKKPVNYLDTIIKEFEAQGGNKAYEVYTEKYNKNK